MSWTNRVALACLLVIFGVSFAADGADRPPNVVFIMADDLGWTDVGCFGSDYHHTPHIDALAASGMKFTSAYASPNCAPTRACLMSGQYTPRHGIYTVQTGARGEAKDRKLIPAANKTVLSLDIPTWAELVREAGYFTAHVGKWHLGDPPRHGPRQQGFDVNVAGFRAGTPPGGYFVPYRNPHLPDGPEGEYLTDRLVDETIKLIHDHQQRPFFIYFEDGRVELYHLPDDIGEQHDLASELPAKRDALHSKMIAWRKAIAAPLPSLEKPE